MSRRIVQDIIPTSKKSIRDIPLPPSRDRERHNRGRQTVEDDSDNDAVRMVREEFERRERGGRKFKKYGMIIGIIVLLVIIFFVADAFAHATVSVTLSSESDPVHGSFVTHSSAAASTTKGITDSVISIVKQSSVTLTATATQDVETKAAGTIIIFNDYSTTPQKLVANTRFKSSGGLIYRIAQSVSVPGKTTKGAVTTPGSVTVPVTADQVGDKYNIDLSDFTIPGFSGEPQFDGIFARSKTSMTGGFSGTRPVIASADRSAAEASIRSDLASQVAAAALSSVPAGYILYPTAERIDYMSLPDTLGSGNTVTINEQATLTGIALSESELGTALAAGAVKSYAGEPINITNIDALAFSTTAVPVGSSTPMSFALSGTADFVWTIDAGTFASQLAGKPKGDFTTILQGYPHVTKAGVSFFPFWLGSFPTNPSDITIATTTAI
jgi:hypothetical protein